MRLELLALAAVDGDDVDGDADDRSTTNVIKRFFFGVDAKKIWYGVKNCDAKLLRFRFQIRK